MPGLVRSATLRQFDTVCHTAGLDPLALLAEVGLPPTVLSDPDLRVPGPKVSEVLQIAAARSGMADFGLRMGRLRGVEDWGLLGLAARDQLTLRGYLETVVARGRYQNENSSGLLATNGDQVEMIIDFRVADVSTRVQAIEMSIAFNLSCIQELVQRDLAPTYVSFQHDRIADLSAYRKHLGVEPFFGAEHLTMAFPTSAMTLPLIGARPQFNAVVDRLLESQTSGGFNRYADVVANNLRALVGAGAFSIERMARLFDMTPRTLQRKLREEGASYSQIVDEVRLAMARDYVERSNRPLGEVSEILGFKSQSALAHWYRQKHGVTALEQRRRARAA
ncbi:AraC family transcriptional regulator [Phenylobacterium aquaticum]|uniref:AraC family transcriptional regulator n=1 Tax=Phenylobacterium aquaticum TaxID=1763816 RepID=UPI0026F35A78|nr:AraC family transcriptional regulator [Phenylobacterium aquaticum]